jgi:uncharacterized protein with gpF-like domain
MPVSPERVDPGPLLKFKLMTPKEAIEFLMQKGFHLGFDWRDTEPAMHQASFTMAKITKIDVLEDIRAAFTTGLNGGLPPEQIVKNLRKTLADKGWWGEKILVDPLTGEEKTVEIGATRLRRAYNINLATAHSEGKWQRIQDNKKFFPFLRYDGCNSAENRKQHCAWDGMVLPVDDPWLPIHHPVKEPGCKCMMRAMTAGEVQRKGIKIGINGSGKAPTERYKLWYNERTRKTESVPVGVHPMFNYPMGGAWRERLSEYASERRDALPENIRNAVGEIE